jgi:hypothetical protein
MVRVLGFENCFRIICREGGIEDSLKDTVYSSLCVNYDRRELVVKKFSWFGKCCVDVPSVPVRLGERRWREGLWRPWTGYSSVVF